MSRAKNFNKSLVKEADINNKVAKICSFNYILKCCNAEFNLVEFKKSDDQRIVLY